MAIWFDPRRHVAGGQDGYDTTLPPDGGNERTMTMAKKKAAKKRRSSGKPADVLPGMPGTFVVMGMSGRQNAKVAAEIRRRLAGG
jgi:hypothetical protein